MAVAIKKHGYTNIKIYNGGIKDWKHAGLPTVSVEPLPEHEVEFIGCSELYAFMQETPGCLDARGKPRLTVVDLRTEKSLEDAAEGVKRIRTSCPVVTGLLDDMRSPEFRARIPKNGLVVTLTETGNRDEIAIRYLRRFGYGNVKAVEFGMRGWIKNKLPIE